MSVMYPEGTKTHNGAGGREDPMRGQGLKGERPRRKYGGSTSSGQELESRSREREWVTAVGNWAAVMLGIVCPGKVPCQKRPDAWGRAVLG